MKVMYLDESGNHSLSIADPDYPIFVLGGVIVDSDYAEGVIEPRLRSFKLDCFGSEEINLHTVDISRNRNGFERLKDAAFRAKFYQELNTLLSDLDYKIVACVIRKGDYLSLHGLGAIDPYMLSLNALVERFCFEIGDIEGGGEIYAEKRSPVLDRELDIAWLNLKVRGTDNLKASTINQRIIGLSSQSKKANVAGLQLADLVVTPIGRHILGKNRHQDWKIVESKLRRDTNSYVDAGLVIIPE